MAGGGQGSGGASPLSAGIGGLAAGQANTPQWLKGLALGTQMAKMGQGQPMQAPQIQRPMMGGPAPGMVGGAVPGGQQPMPMGGGMMAPGMASGGMGMQQPQPGGQGQINPQILQMLMRARG